MEVVNENAPSLLQRQLTIRIERQEERLASQLRQFCNNDGKEIDLKRSIPILHSLGKEYQKRSPDKFSLIRSSALYNAALVRSPENAEEIEKDLKELCRLILVEANANKKDRDLIAKAKLVKENVVKLRLKVHEKLSGLNDQETKRIDDIRQLQIEIASDYTEIMAQTAAFCEDVMGEAPFAFAVAGMGSLARREITPYSDFEHIILLSNSARRDDNYKEKLEYYRWFSVIFQVILINLQETILPSLSIISLNGESSRLGNWFYDGYTPRGIAFDGMMLHACKFPLGRQEWSTQKQWKTELIKPIDEMLDYLRSEESLKNGYHLSDILTKTCFVYKDQDVYNVYENGVYQRLEHAADDNSTEEEIKKQVSDDLRNFAIRSAISDINVKDKFNIKHVIYRSTTLFISAMGRMHNIRASSCFDVVEELARRKKITAYARNMLMFAVALACEVRLRWYMINNAQCDEINSDLENETDAISKLCEIVGRKSSIKYFHIAYALQCDIARRLKLPKHQFYSNPHLLNLNIGHCFDDLDYLRSSISSSNYTISDERFYNFDECMRALNVSEISQVTEPRHVVSMEEIQKFGISLFRMSLYNDALECFEKVAERFQQVDAGESDHSCEDWRIAYNYYLIGSCLTYLGRFRRAAQCLEECIEMFEQTPTNSADAKYWIGRCLLQQKKPEQAVRFFVESSRHIMPLEQLNENDRLEPFNESMRLSFQPQEMIRNIDVAGVDPCLESDVQIAYKHYWVGICFIDMRKHQNAIPYLETALELIEKTFQSKEKDNGIAEILKRLGCCLMNDVKKLKTAINYFNRSLEIKKAVSHKLTFDNEIAEIQHLLGWCLVKQSKFKDAISFFRLSLETIEQLSLDANYDMNIAEANYAIGNCLLSLKKPKQAIKNFENSLRIKLHFSTDVNTDSAVSHLYRCLGMCYLRMADPQKAIGHFNRSLQIQENISQNTTIDKDVAETLDYISRCLLVGKETREAIKYLQRAIQIFELAAQHGRSMRTRRFVHNRNFKTTMYCASKWCPVKCLHCYRKTFRFEEPLAVTAKTVFTTLNFCCCGVVIALLLAGVIIFILFLKESI